MALSIADFVRGRPFNDFAPLRRLMEAPVDPHLGGNCIELAREFSAQLEGVQARVFARAEDEVHHAVLTEDARGLWYWDPSLQQAEPFNLKVLEDQFFASCTAFPRVAGRMSTLNFANMGHGSFTVSKRLYKPEPPHVHEKRFFRYNQKDFVNEPLLSDEELVDGHEDGAFSFEHVLPDGGVLSFTSTDGLLMARKAGRPVPVKESCAEVSQLLGLAEGELFAALNDIQPLYQGYCFLTR